MRYSLKTCLLLGLSVSTLIAYNSICMAETKEKPEAPANVEVEKTPQQPDPFYGNNISGQYLASEFAQRHHDWKRADKNLEKVIQAMPDEPQLIKRKMVLAMGAGNYESAIEMARKTVATDPDYTLAHLFLVADAFKHDDFEQAKKQVNAIPAGSLASFMQPLLKSWSSASFGKNETEELTRNTVHIHHAILIADYLKDYKQIELLLEKTLSRDTLGIQDMERVGDIYAHIGQRDKATELYERALKELPSHPGLPEKITALKNGEDVSYFEPVSNIKEGVARAFYDMAHLLYKDASDDSARVFAYLTLYLKPDMMESNLLLADIFTRNDRLDQAIESYLEVPPDKPYFIDSQRRAGDLMDDNNDRKGALKLFEKLATEYNDIESRIRIGDLYRQNEDFKNALIHYNLAAKTLGKEIPADYWHLLYVRGMCYEQLDQWEQAEKDLKAALEYQPNHPFILNYLGYSWADQGKNLDEALEMIMKAVKLRPHDGYITDSLGWAYYKMGDYEQAVPILERAVELLPYDPVMNDHLGDAYWRVGRKMEASFQWQRAKNFTEDQDLIGEVDLKLVNGLPAVEGVKETTNHLTDTEHQKR